MWDQQNQGAIVSSARFLDQTQTESDMKMILSIMRGLIELGSFWLAW